MLVNPVRCQALGRKGACARGQGLLSVVLRGILTSDEQLDNTDKWKQIR